MKIVNEYPPNYEQICKAFPEVKNLPNTVFTWGGTLYVPNGNDTISKDLEIHENYHTEQQCQKGTSPAAWWQRYLTDPEFRAQEELGAYQRQYRFARLHRPGYYYRTLLDRIAGDLSSGMYGNIYTFDEAKKLIMGKYK